MPVGDRYSGDGEYVGDRDSGDGEYVGDRDSGDVCSVWVFLTPAWTGILNGFWKRTINTWSI